MFGIVQGGTDAALRARSCQEIAEHAPYGYGIGGLSVGEPRSLMTEMLHVTAENLPEEKPRHLLGVGYAQDIEEAVKYGVDLFDTVLPTRLARHGSYLTDDTFETVRKNEYRADPDPLVKGCDCTTCQKYSRAYLRHLVAVQEIAAFTLITIHNLRTLIRKMENIRARIRAGKI